LEIINHCLPEPWIVYDLESEFADAKLGAKNTKRIKCSWWEIVNQLSIVY